MGSCSACSVSRRRHGAAPRCQRRARKKCRRRHTGKAQCATQKPKGHGLAGQWTCLSKPGPAMPDSSAPPLDQDSSRSAMSLCTTCAQINPLEICSSRNRDRLKGAGYTARARLRTQRARERDAPACIRPDEQPEDLGGGLLPPSLDILYITCCARSWPAYYSRRSTRAP
jgi:hypothetical protein